MTTKRETCLTCGKVFMTGPNTTARDVAQAHESMTGHTIERSVKPAPRIVAECCDGFDCPHGRHYTNRHDAENCPHGDYDGPPLDAEIYHRAAGHDVREVKP